MNRKPWTWKLTLGVILIIGLGIQHSTAQDYLEYLLATHDLVELPEKSKTNMGSDNLYIGDYKNGKHEFSMSFQKYLPNKGGPTILDGQSDIVPIKMLPTAKGGGGEDTTSGEAEDKN